MGSFPAHGQPGIICKCKCKNTLSMFTSSSRVFQLRKVRLFCHQRHFRWRGAVPPLWLRPKELPSMVQVNESRCTLCKDWIYITVKIKLKLTKTLKTMHFHFDGLTLINAQGGSRYISWAKSRPYRGGSCQPRENGGWHSNLQSRNILIEFAEPLFIFWHTEKDKDNAIRNGDGYDSKNNNADHESQTVIMLNVRNCCDCVERR